MDRWKNYNFKSSTVITEGFKEFARDFRRYIKNSLPVGLRLAEFSVGHFHVNGFIRKKNKFVYFSTMDIIHSPYSWMDNILVRTAKNIEDFIGGNNNYVHISDFSEKVKELLK